MDDMTHEFITTNDLLAAIGFLFAAGAIVSAVMVAQTWWERLNTPGALAHDGPRPADYVPGTLPTHSVTGTDDTSAQETQPLLQSVLLPLGSQHSRGDAHMTYCPLCVFDLMEQSRWTLPYPDGIREYCPTHRALMPVQVVGDAYDAYASYLIAATQSEWATRQRNGGAR